MSAYLIGEIEYNPRISVRTCTAVVDGGGDGRLEWLAPRGRRAPASGSRCRRTGLFLLLGAEPHCDWLPDRRWRATSAASCSPAATCRGTAGSTACRRRTSPPRCPAIFAAGDIRAGSMKRVAAASGEGASVVPLVHAFLAPAPAERLPSSERYGGSAPGRETVTAAARAACASTSAISSAGIAQVAPVAPSRPAPTARRSRRRRRCRRPRSCRPPRRARGRDLDRAPPPDPGRAVAAPGHHDRGRTEREQVAAAASARSRSG